MVDTVIRWVVVCWRGWVSVRRLADSLIRLLCASGADRSRCVPTFCAILAWLVSGMSVLNPICCVLAMNYASPSILEPFSGLILVWVLLFSYPVVGEQPFTSRIVAACFIITGEVIVAIFGDQAKVRVVAEPQQEIHSFLPRSAFQ
jgi:drug/metabolite transporter (DMT)-like permease